MKTKKYIKKENKKDFTLIELIIVIAILAILAGILIPNMIAYLDESQNTVCMANRRTMKSEVLLDFVANNKTIEDAFNTV